MIRQRTIKETVSIDGIGLQTGKRSSVCFKSAPENSGIRFIRTDLPGRPVLTIGNLGKSDALRPERRTTLSEGAAEIQTIEHLLAVLSSLAISNIFIEVDNAELPGLDGSARDYLDILNKAGVIEQSAEQEILKVEIPVWCEGKNGSFLAAFPSDDFRISYTLDYNSPGIGTQHLDVVINRDVFSAQIASARTFCLEREALLLKVLGFGKGAGCDNTLVMGKTGPVKNRLRFRDEPVRHKVLDLIGDLYLTGMPLEARIIAIKSGHALNMELVKKLIAHK